MGIELGDWIRRRRDDLGLKRKDLLRCMSTDGVHVDSSYLSQVEAGRIDIPRQPYLNRLATCLETSEITLLRVTGLITEPPNAGNPYPPDTPEHTITDALPHINRPDLWILEQITVFMRQRGNKPEP